MADRQKAVFHVGPEVAQQSLGTILRHWQADLSWSQIHQLLRTRRVLLDGNLAQDASRRLQAGQVIKLLEHSQAPPATENDVRIIHCDADVLVVDKPSGITTMRHADEKLWPARRRQLQPTLTELLPRVLARRERNQGARAAPHAVRPVHRLDRETSGLMVFARNVKAETMLGHQFREHTIRRVYWAIVAGRVEAQRIDTQLVRDRGDGRRGTSSHGEVGKRAVTHVQPLDHLSDFTLVECRLETGRTHQIRIHLADIGHPVCGDKVYGARPASRQSGKALSPPRLALHAGHLGFVHPRTTELVEFASPFPQELAQFLERLRNRTGGPSAGDHRDPPDRGT